MPLIDVQFRGCYLCPISFAQKLNGATLCCSCQCPSSGGSVAGMRNIRIKRGTIVRGTRLMRCLRNLARSAADLFVENGLDKCSSLPSSDMKIGSHSGLLQPADQYFICQNRPVSRRSPHTHVPAGSRGQAWPSGAQCCCMGDTAARGGWLGPSEGLLGFSSLPQAGRYGLPK